MNFAIPRNDVSEFILYIWKIIDIPYISISDLLYRVSFDLFLLCPEKAIEFINTAIENKLLLKDANNIISLSQNLNIKV